MPGFTDENFRKMWDKFDRNKSGDISMSEFISAISNSEYNTANSQKKNIAQ